jgi:hypothetical protein
VCVCAWVCSEKQTTTRQKPAEPAPPKFEEFDTNGDGKIDKSEAEKALTKNAAGCVTLVLSPAVGLRGTPRQ